MTAPVLVIGATGKTGRRVADKLAAKGVAVRRGARGSATPFDWTQRETWAPALRGVRAVYVTYFPDLAVPGATDDVAALTEMAREAGVEKIVLLSGRGEQHAEAAEAVVARSGLRYTLVRCAWFAQNFSEGVMRDAVMGGVLALPAGDVPEPIVDADDIADVVVAALTEPGHDGQLYELTGPRLLTFGEMASAIGAAMGRPVQFQPISFEELHAALAAGGDTAMADLVTMIMRETMDGRNAVLADGVERALGRPPRDFADYCRDAAAAGAWKLAA